MVVGLGDAEHLRDHRDGQRLRDRRQEVELAGALHAVDERIDDALDAGAEPLHERRREGLRHQAAHARVVGRLHVEDPVADQVPERLVPLGVGRVPHLLVARLMQVRAAEPAVAQQRVHVGVACDEPVVGALVVRDRPVPAELLVDGVGVGDERGVGGGEVRRRAHARTVAVQEGRGSAAPTAPTVRNPRRE